MTKALLEIDSELWKQARHYGVEHDLNNNEIVTLALERLLMPVAGRQNFDDLRTNTTQPYDNVTTVRYEDVAIDNVNVSDNVLRNVTPAGFGSSRPAPKPMKKAK